MSGCGSQKTGQYSPATFSTCESIGRFSLNLFFAASVLLFSLQKFSLLKTTSISVAVACGILLGLSIAGMASVALVKFRQTCDESRNREREFWIAISRDLSSLS